MDPAGGASEHPQMCAPGELLPYLSLAPFVNAHVLSNFLNKSQSFKPFGPSNGW